MKIKNENSVLFLLDCSEFWHTVHTSLEQKLSGGLNNYKEEKLCSYIVAVVLKHGRITPPFTVFSRVTFCYLLLNSKCFVGSLVVSKLLEVVILFLFPYPTSCLCIWEQSFFILRTIFSNWNEISWACRENQSEGLSA